MAVAKETSHQTFFSFSQGVKVTDFRIEDWIRKGLEAVRSGKPHYSASTGDTTVVVLDHSHNDRSRTSIDVIVATSDGVSRVSLASPNEEPDFFYRDLVEKGGPVR
jgi:hypothetical protein